jgi:hypothetical protein
MRREITNRRALVPLVSCQSEIGHQAPPPPNASPTARAAFDPNQRTPPLRNRIDFSLRNGPSAI